MNENSERIFPCGDIVRFKERLVEAMNGESSRGFAARCGLSDTVIRNYLSGKTYPSLDRLAMIAEASGKPLVWFISDNECEYKSAPASQTHTESTSGSEVSLHEKLQSIFNLMSEAEMARAIEMFKLNGLSGLMPSVLTPPTAQEILRGNTSISEGSPSASVEPQPRETKKAG